VSNIKISNNVVCLVFKLEFSKELMMACADQGVAKHVADVVENNLGSVLERDLFVATNLEVDRIYVGLDSESRVA